MTQYPSAYPIGYTAGQNREPNYVNVTARVIEEATTMDFLNDACALLGDAQWNLSQALRKSVYFEEDEYDVEKMNQDLQRMYDKLLGILRARGVL